MPQQRPGKEGGTRERNRQARTDALCRAALKLFLERGLETTTVEDITKAAGVAKGSFYRYFPDKAGLIESLFSPLEEQMVAAMERCRLALTNAESTDELNLAYGNLASDLVGLLAQSEDAVRLYLQENRGPAEGARRPIRRLSDSITDRAIGLTETAYKQGMLRDLPANVTAVAVVGSVEAILVRQYQGQAIDDPLMATTALISMVLDGIRLPK